MSLSTDVLLFSVVLMLMAVQIEASGYGSGDPWVAAGLAVAVLGILGSLVSAARSAEPPTADGDDS
ncbi:hypothetical protein [Halorientalis litorea]|uniref:hypothetical protein n=1 Tax=Halorientalis litorea TaxID=2931977 RepID=UPI001FF3C639|nr:hypothetical protein [Halorientalis litorea]